jgi:NAD(P)-dependent dehydrogenase (short-subunit alcohol dehydrogenase family)
MQGLKDNVFIVTGGGSGIGAATVSRLLAEGAQVRRRALAPKGSREREPRPARLPPIC